MYRWTVPKIFGVEDKREDKRLDILKARDFMKENDVNGENGKLKWIVSKFGIFPSSTVLIGSYAEYLKLLEYGNVDE